MHANFFDAFDRLSPDELERLPIGIVRLDRTGAITYYNAAEATLAHRRVDETLGRNFFADVAPCTGVRKFRAAYEDFVMSPQRRHSATFSFRFLFGWGQREVEITFARRWGDDGIFIVVVASEVL